ncbi:uncharacterized protein K452DRAFT_313519 [Aplosporella prunicola CBS 121167]|uniref:Uncharacterized protein n=1 Tax=Aplosporella prunicola CBS 121167 TaxID=1176127 RepID=A0A6A6AXQ9_9PEZI|nr:uncharacterized protein K452DRAFT_313519 [Aplosporella prunicola CBS 121167]KAF2136038.1 hypothetical protein K452DRAFT_313519 [Aplosporella prunicola CBS 121167]
MAFRLPTTRQTSPTASTISTLTTTPDDLTIIHASSDVRGPYIPRLRDIDGSLFNPAIATGFTMVPLTRAELRRRTSHIWGHGFLANHVANGKQYWLCKRCHPRFETPEETPNYRRWRYAEDINQRAIARVPPGPHA